MKLCERTRLLKILDTRMMFMEIRKRLKENIAKKYVNSVKTLERKQNKPTGKFGFKHAVFGTSTSNT